jgi:hypothetical protein
MSERHPLLPLIGMGVIAVVASVLGTLLIWVWSDLQAQLFAFYTGQDGTQPVADEVYREWDRISMMAYRLQSLAMPLFLVALIAVFAVLAVLARRADLRHRRPRSAAEPQDDAATAS